MNPNLAILTFGSKALTATPDADPMAFAEQMARKIVSALSNVLKGEGFSTREEQLAQAYWTIKATQQKEMYILTIKTHWPEPDNDGAVQWVCELFNNRGLWAIVTDQSRSQYQQAVCTAIETVLRSNHDLFDVRWLAKKEVERLQGGLSVSDQSKQITTEVLAMQSRNLPETEMINRLHALTPGIDEAHAREHLEFVLEGYAHGHSMGWLLFRSHFGVDGPELFVAAYLRGFRDGSRKRLFLKIIPLSFVVILAVVVYKTWM